MSSVAIYNNHVPESSEVTTDSDDNIDDPPYKVNINNNILLI